MRTETIAMPTTSQNPTNPTLLLIAASRGLGLAIAEEFLKRSWNVVGTVRLESNRERLDELRTRYADRLEIETLDICEEAQITALRQRLKGRKFEMLFVNAGITNENGRTTPIGDVSSDEFVRVMTTNALAPMRTIEQLDSLVTKTGLIGVMSSGRGSVTNNTGGEEELYRGSKSALNQFMRSYAARHSESSRAMALMAPGWVRTELGGPEARLSIGESIPRLVETLLKKQGSPGLEYLDYLGRTVPW